jgi:choline dehydrogenase-like flavoprotein
LSRETDVLVVGSGFAGLLVARELVAVGREVTLLERGARVAHAQQLARSAHELDCPTARHNHESHPETPYPWEYCYGVGGSSLHWTGVAPRFLPSDFELHSRFGVGRDWPFGYSELEPYYPEAETLLQVACGDERLEGAGPSGGLPAHPLSPVDELLAGELAPFFPVPQARASKDVAGRPACCGATTCDLCPVDARFSVLHLLDDTGLGADPRLEIRERTVASRLVTANGRVQAVETVGSGDEPGTLRARTVVLAANGLENPGILLRSGLDGRDVGVGLFDHGHRLLHIELDRLVPNGRGAAHTTGISYAYGEGDWRATRGAQLMLPLNRGLLVWQELVEGLAAGRRGRELRAATRERFERTLLLDTVGEDLPRADRRVELSPSRDTFGLPLNRVRYPGDSAYAEAGREHMYADIERRLRPLGARIAEVEHVSYGAHQLGTCRMGTDDGAVVDPDGRHHDFENLYVTGGSAFPTYSAAHPTLTICALAIRLGRMLAASGR